MEAYRRHFGQFGKRIPGLFTDEPHLSPFGRTRWTERLPDEFRPRWGYDLVAHFPVCIGPWATGGASPQLFPTVAGGVHRSLGQARYEYCERNQLEFTGHYWEHGWPVPARQRQHGDVCLASATGHRQPDEPVQRGRQRTVRQQPHGQRTVQRRQPLDAAARSARPTEPAVGTCGLKT